MWDKLDEVLISLIGASVLGSVAIYAIMSGYNGGTAQACIVALSAVLCGALGLKGSHGGGAEPPASLRRLRAGWIAGEERDIER